jgi:hypothetical protein
MGLAAAQRPPNAPRPAPRRASFVEECAKRGLLVMPDMHRLAAAKDIPEL